jgi:outer membrane biosynthesis protein TonB
MKTLPRWLTRWLAGGVLGLAAGAGAPAMTNEETARTLGLRKFVLPDYPAMLQMEGVAEGEALVVIGRDVAGRPRDVLALETTRPEFARAAETAVLAWRFAPADASAQASGGRPPLVRFIFKSGGVTVAASHVPPVPGRPFVEAEAIDYHPVSFEDLDRMPKALRQPLPAFPRSLAGKVTTGEASVTFFVDETGRVRIPAVTAASAPEFAAAALETVTQWTYEPPLRAGHPVVARESLKIQFGPPPRG